MINSPELSPGDVQPSRAFVDPHIVNGAVASYVVRNCCGERVAIFTATRGGMQRATSLAASLNQHLTQEGQ